MLGFNAMYFIDPTASSTYRSIEALRPTLIDDENEDMRFVSKNDLATKKQLQMYRAGYKPGGTVPRTEKDEKNKKFILANYDVYCPKVISNITGVDDVLQDRAIPIIMQRAVDPNIADSEPDEHEQVWQNMRDRLYHFGLTHAKFIYNTYQQLKPPMDKDGNALLTGRDWELWKPLFAIAFLLDLEIRQLTYVDEAGEINARDIPGHISKEREAYLNEKLAEMERDTGLKKLDKDSPEASEVRKKIVSGIVAESILYGLNDEKVREEKQLSGELGELREEGSVKEKAVSGELGEASEEYQDIVGAGGIERLEDHRLNFVRNLRVDMERDLGESKYRKFSIYTYTTSSSSPCSPDTVSSFIGCSPVSDLLCLASGELQDQKKSYDLDNMKDLALLQVLVDYGYKTDWHLLKNIRTDLGEFLKGEYAGEVPKNFKCPSPKSIGDTLRRFGFNKTKRDPSGTKSTMFQLDQNQILNKARLYGIISNGEVEKIRFRQGKPKPLDQMVWGACIECEGTGQMKYHIPTGPICEECVDKLGKLEN
tara:strand:- start:1059 stop:2672 length:1614 start_codon:yes stop_codon:yes gene_type:complete